MSEETTTGEVSSETTGQAQGDPSVLGEAGKRALTAEREARSKAEKTVRELEAQVVAAQEAAGKAKTEFEAVLREKDRELETARGERDRYQLGLELGIPEDVLSFVPVGSREEMESSIERLKPHLRNPDKDGVLKRDPVQGASGGRKAPTTANAFEAWVKSL